MEGVSPSGKKILNEFSLTPESCDVLQTFFDARFQDLHSFDAVRRSNAMGDLIQQIEATFPEQSLAELRNVLAGQSELALLIKNCPERKGFETGTIDDAIPENSYSHYLGQALYEMCGAHHTRTVVAKRRSHHSGKSQYPQGFAIVHRDNLEVNQPDGSGKYSSRYVVFSAPNNSEHAPTEIIDLKAAIQSIPEAERAKIQVLVHDNYGEFYPPFTPPISLSQLLERLDRSVGTVPFVRYVSLPVTIDYDDSYFFTYSPESQRFMRAVEEHSVKVDLQPGDLLVVNENSMFHSAHWGDKTHIAQIPKEHTLSRMLLHIAGAPGSARGM